jgi:hypothetical protein
VASLLSSAKIRLTGKPHLDRLFVKWLNYFVSTGEAATDVNGGLAQIPLYCLKNLFINIYNV